MFEAGAQDEQAGPAVVAVAGAEIGIGGGSGAERGEKAGKVHKKWEGAGPKKEHNRRLR